MTLLYRCLASYSFEKPICNTSHNVDSSHNGEHPLVAVVFPHHYKNHSYCICNFFLFSLFFQTIFIQRNKSQKNPLGLCRQQGFTLDEYFIGQSIGKGCSAAVYEAAAPFAASCKTNQVPKAGGCNNNGVLDIQAVEEDPSQAHFPLAIKMMWNISVRI